MFVCLFVWLFGLQVALFDADGNTTTVPARVLPTASTDVPAIVGLPAPAAVFLNWNDHAYAKIRMDPVSIRGLSNMLNPAVIPSELNRTLLWDVFYDMTRDAELPVTEFLSMAREKVRFGRCCVGCSCVLFLCGLFCHAWCVCFFFFVFHTPRVICGDVVCVLAHAAAIGDFSGHHQVSAASTCRGTLLVCFISCLHRESARSAAASWSQGCARLWFG